MKARCNNNISSITYKSLLNQTSSTYKSAAKAQGNVKNIKKPIQPIYVQVMNTMRNARNEYEK